MRLLFFFQVFFFCTLLVFGQSYNNLGTKSLRDFNAKLRANEIGQKKYISESEIEGSPYIQKEFISGKIIKRDGNEYKEILLRYNVYNNAMEFKQNGTILEIADPQTIDRILLNDKIFVYSKYSAFRKFKASYFQLLNEQKYQLLKKYNVLLKGSDASTGFENQHQKMKFEKMPPTYYFRYRNGTAHQISSQKELIKILQPIPEEITKYIQNNLTNPKDEAQLIDILDHINKGLD